MDDPREEVKRVAIVQSSYVPWKGYFDMINLADELILLDSVQFTRRDWRNRNRIKTPQGARWLTIPVITKGRYLQRIDEVEVEDPGWADRHWRTLGQHYQASPCFATMRELVQPLFFEGDQSRLTEINRRLLTGLCELLGIHTPITRDTDYELRGSSSERLLALCLQAGATHYLSGPAARAYLDVEAFAERAVEVEWMDYSGYPRYPQLHPPFEHGVSVLDLLFNTGGEAPSYMKSFGSRQAL